MGKPSKTGAKATAAAALAKKSRAPVVKKVSRSMRKLLAKNARKAKNRAERQAKALPADLYTEAVLLHKELDETQEAA